MEVNSVVIEGEKKSILKGREWVSNVNVIRKIKENKDRLRVMEVIDDLIRVV